MHDALVFLAGMLFMFAIVYFFVHLDRWLNHRKYEREWKWHKRGWDD